MLTLIDNGASESSGSRPGSPCLWVQVAGLVPQLHAGTAMGGELADY